MADLEARKDQGYERLAIDIVHDFQMVPNKFIMNNSYTVAP